MSNPIIVRVNSMFAKLRFISTHFMPIPLYQSELIFHVFLRNHFTLYQCIICETLNV